MNKNQLLTPFLVITLLGTAGCAGNNRAGVYDSSNDNVRPIGYYSNENHPKNNGTGLFADNDGPLTEMMDHSLGAEGQITDSQRRKSLQTRDENGNPPNPTKPLAANDQFLKKDNRFSAGDVNYHDQLSENNGYHTTDPKTLGRISDRIRQKVINVNNVQNVRSVVFGSSVLISVDLIDNRKAGATKKDIQNAVKPYVKNRAVTVIMDEGTFSRDRNNQTGVRAGTK